MVAQEEMMKGMVRCERPVNGDILVGSMAQRKWYLEKRRKGGHSKQLLVRQRRGMRTESVWRLKGWQSTPESGGRW